FAMVPEVTLGPTARSWRLRGTWAQPRRHRTMSTTSRHDEPLANSWSLFKHNRLNRSSGREWTHSTTLRRHRCTERYHPDDAGVDEPVRPRRSLRPCSQGRSSVGALYAPGDMAAQSCRVSLTLMPRGQLGMPSP